MNILEKMNTFTSTMAFKFILTLIICLIACKIILKIIYKIIDELKVEQTIARFLKQVIKASVYFIATLVVGNSLGINTSSIIALASVFTAAFALAAQSSLSNLFGGILLLVTKPFCVGDYISANGTEGSVEEIQMLNTVLSTPDNKRVTIPNGSISTATITNYSNKGSRRVDITIDASYDNSLEDVKKALKEAIEMTDNILTSHEPFIRLSGYGDNNLQYTVRVWATVANYWTVHFDLLENIKKSFEKNNISISYPRVIISK